MKICIKCKVPKPESEFHKDKNERDRLTRKCKICRNEESKAWRAKNPDKVKEIILKTKDSRTEYYKREEVKHRYRMRDLMKNFGISEEDYNKLLEKSGGVCTICKKPEQSNRNKFLSVDHCHTTGKIRGLLCSRCNRALGLFSDDKNLLNLAIKYLENHE